MENDEGQRGRVLTRRELLALIGAAVTVSRAPDALAWVADLAGAAGPGGCVVRPEQTTGPYFVDETLHRSDIRSDPSDGALQPGAQLDLAFQVARLTDGHCTPVSGARVDIWHCDARGIYSNVQDPRFDTTGKKYLRGYQLTDDHGVARFTTIYPGWYLGRAVHIQFKIRSAGDTPSYEITSQLYFDDELTDSVHALGPYAAKGAGRTRNARDRIYRRGGAQLLLDVARRDAGYAASFDIALQT